MSTTTPTRPVPLPVNPQHIAPSLRQLSSWVAWGYRLRDGKWTKPPLRAQGGGLASTTDAATWAPFPVALDALGQGGVDGLGLVLQDDVVAVDLDHCLDANGVPEEWAGEVLSRFCFAGAYAERSPGGDGLRLFCRGAFSRSGKSGPQNRLEVYTRESPRYMTATGHRLPQSAEDIGPAQSALDWLWATYYASKERHEGPRLQGTSAPTLAGDDEALAGARARHGERFARLYDRGDWRGNGHPSQSEADLSLACMLADTAADAAQIDRIFRRGALMREKWSIQHGAATYGALTIERALSARSAYRWGGTTWAPASALADDGAGWLDGVEVDKYRQSVDFDSEPPPIRSLIHPLFLRGALTVLAGDGGVLKSMLMFGAQLELATGVPLITAPCNAFTLVEQGATLFLTGEEDSADIQRRRAKWIARAGALAGEHGLGKDYVTQLRHGAHRAVVLPLAGQVMTLYRNGGPTEAMAALERLCLRVPGLVQVTVDPLGTFFRGETKEGEDMGGFAIALRAIASRLGISVALVHHTTKAASNLAAATGEAMTQHAALGSVMLINAARVGAIMQRMPTKAALGWGIEPADAHRYVALATPKANGVEALEQQWFHNVAGCPVPVALAQTPPAQAREEKELAKLEKKSEVLSAELMAWAQSEFNALAPISKTALAKLLSARAHVRLETVQGFVESEVSRGALIADPQLRIKGSAQGGVRPGPQIHTSFHKPEGF